MLNLLSGNISSLGMSYSELCGILPGEGDAVEKACELAQALNLRRLCVHSDTWALTITRDDPFRELEALLFGSLLASVRAEKGVCSLPANLPGKAEFHELNWKYLQQSNERSVVSCATPYIERPTATIGLGDTFLAGTLLVLGGALTKRNYHSYESIILMKTLKQFDSGKLRSLQRVTTADWFFLICALDHLSDFQELLDPDPRTVDYRRTCKAKLELIELLARECSAFLLDARYGLAQAIASGALPGSVGLMASIEDEDYKPSTVHRKTRFREHWSVRQMKLLGVDVCILLWFYRPESHVAEHQRDVVRSLVSECGEYSIPLVVEPI